MKNENTYPRLDSGQYIGERADIFVKHGCTKSYPLHWHNYFEIEIVTDGEAVHTLNGKKHLISKGSAYILKTTDFHEVETQSSVKIYNISFKENVLDEKLLLRLVSATDNVYSLNDCKYEMAVATAKLLKNESESGGEYRRILLEYLIHIITDIKGTESAKPEQLTGIKKALLYMELHFREKITLDEIAKQGGYNPSYFSRLFKKITGETFVARLNSLRLEYACMLLSKGCSVSYACFESGFSSSSYFFTAFKNKYNVSPSEYTAKE